MYVYKKLLQAEQLFWIATFPSKATIASVLVREEPQGKEKQLLIPQNKHLLASV